MTWRARRLAIVGSLGIALLAAHPIVAGESTPICLGDGGTQACGPLVACEYYGTVWVRNSADVPVQITVDGIWRADECDSPTPRVDPIASFGPRVTTPPTDTAP